MVPMTTPATMVGDFFASEALSEVDEPEADIVAAEVKDVDGHEE